MGLSMGQLRLLLIYSVVIVTVILFFLFFTYYAIIDILDTLMRKIVLALVAITNNLITYNVTITVCSKTDTFGNDTWVPSLVLSKTDLNRSSSIDGPFVCRIIMPSVIVQTLVIYRPVVNLDSVS